MVPALYLAIPAFIPYPIKFAIAPIAKAIKNVFTLFTEPVITPPTTAPTPPKPNAPSQPPNGIAD